jgi:hypothetical protein
MRPLLERSLGQDGLLPPLPGKKWTGSTSQEVVDKRSRLYVDYVQAAMRHCDKPGGRGPRDTDTQQAKVLLEQFLGMNSGTHLERNISYPTRERPRTEISAGRQTSGAHLNRNISYATR